jgi:hypothetical protein
MNLRYGRALVVIATLSMTLIPVSVALIPAHSHAQEQQPPPPPPSNCCENAQYSGSCVAAAGGGTRCDILATSIGRVCSNTAQEDIANCPIQESDDCIEYNMPVGAACHYWDVAWRRNSTCNQGTGQCSI